MGKLLHLFAIIVIVALSAADNGDGCGKNAHSVTCSNACVATCTHRKPTRCGIIEQNCKPGCKCKDGYFKKSRKSSECVTADKCPAKKIRVRVTCGVNEIVDTCINNPRPCPNSSGDPIVGQIDPRSCKKGCRCKDGYIRSGANHTCVPGERCPQHYYKD